MTSKQTTGSSATYEPKFEILYGHRSTIHHDYVSKSNIILESGRVPVYRSQWKERIYAPVWNEDDPVLLYHWNEFDWAATAKHLGTRHHANQTRAYIVYSKKTC